MVSRNSRFVFLFLAGVLGANLSWAAADLSQLRVFPNPVRVYSGQTQVNFQSITDQVTLKIFDISGRLIWEQGTSNSGGALPWLLTNTAGENVASGIYIYLLTNDAGEKKSGKVAIVR